MVTRLQFYCIVIMLPLLADIDHDIALSREDVSCYQLGLIISTQMAGQLIGSQWFGGLCIKMGHKNSILFGYFWIMAASFGFAYITRISDNSMFLLTAFILRLIVGLGLGICNETIFDLFRVDFPKQRIQFKGKYLASESVGYLLGPIMVAALYPINGFFTVFMGLATMTAIGFLGTAYFLPARLNTLNETDENSLKKGGFNDTIKNASNVVPYGTFFKNSRSFMSIMFLFFGACFAIFASVVFPIHLANNDMSVALIAFSYEFALVFNLLTSIGL